MLTYLGVWSLGLFSPTFFSTSSKKKKKKETVKTHEKHWVISILESRRQTVSVDYIQLRLSDLLVY